jgi:hypothetical protein
MGLSERNRKILIEYLHQKLEQYSNDCSNDLLSEKRVKPFGESEEKVIKAILENPEGFKSYFERVLWQCSHGILFDFLCIIDGVGDPDDKEWTDVLLIDKPKGFNEHVEFLHDEF